MDLLLTFVLKSLLVAGVTLGLLRVLANRSAAERSMVAHFGLLALLIVPVGSMFLPQLVVEAPLLATGSAPAPSRLVEPAVTSLTVSPVVSEASLPTVEQTGDIDWWPLLYGVPAAVLLSIIALALLRLFALRARASVLVEPSWLTALAHAQRRMDFKHGTALLTSPDLRSPISWGLLRPVILLNEEALEARGDAEAVIAHELAHVRSLDWAKLLLARAVTAMHWFNPLVWMLAREAHQLREETADDAVLAADVPNAAYAELLVGVARHDCKGLLLGAHGVAPGKGSLTRRVRRVLDSSLPRGPVARGFGAGLTLGVVATAAPLAALSFTPAAASVQERGPVSVSGPDLDRSLPAVVARAVTAATARSGNFASASVVSALADAGLVDASASGEVHQLTAVHPHPGWTPVPPAPPVPPTAAARAVGRERHDLDDPIERAIAYKALGVTADYAAAVRAAAPYARIADDDLLGMKAVGIRPDWLREMTRSGYRPADIGDVIGARAVGVSPAYISDLSAAGYPNLPLDDLTSMRAVGVTGGYIRSLRQAGITGLRPDKLVELRAHGINAGDLRQLRRGTTGSRHTEIEPAEPPEPLEPPEPPEPPEAPDDN